MSNELLVGNVDLHSCFLSFGILRAASQEVAHDEFVESLLIALRSNSEKGQCPPRLTRHHKISGTSGEDFLLMIMLRLLSLFIKQHNPSSSLWLHPPAGCWCILWGEWEGEPDRIWFHSEGLAHPDPKSSVQTLPSLGPVFAVLPRQRGSAPWGKCWSRFGGN